jgi:hypothetical protein
MTNVDSFTFLFFFLQLSCVSHAKAPNLFGLVSSVVQSVSQAASAVHQTAGDVAAKFDPSGKSTGNPEFIHFVHLVNTLPKEHPDVAQILTPQDIQLKLYAL